MKKKLFVIVIIFITLPFVYSQTLEQVLRNLQPAELTMRLEETNRKINIEPQNAGLYIERGLICYFLNNYEEAEKDFTYLINLNPEFYYYYLLRAELYSEMNKLYEALYDLREAIKYESGFDPLFGRLYYRYGDVFYRLNMKEEALIAFTAALQRDRSDSKSHWMRGIIYYDLEKYREAAFNFTNAINLSNGDWIYWFYRGRAFLMFKDIVAYDAAISDFTNALAFAPSDILYLIYTYRGTAYIGLNENSQEALNDFNRGIECNPNSSTLYYLRAMVYDELAKKATSRTDRTRYNRLVAQDRAMYEKLRRDGERSEVDVIERALR